MRKYLKRWPNRKFSVKSDVKTHVRTRTHMNIKESKK